MTRNDCAALDDSDTLAPLRDQFQLPAGIIYLDGNSLGALPRTTAQKLAHVATQEWGTDLIQSWNKAAWITQPFRIGDKIARLIGAAPGEVVAADSTSLNLYKVLSVALSFAHADAPHRRVIVSERDNFPTDLYIAESLAAQRGVTLRLVDRADIAAACDDSLAVLLLTHVNYRTGHMHNMADLTARAHQAGALTIWDLAHSAGAVPVALNEANADFAVGCGYKYLNGGPGAPAFLWLHQRHAARMDREQLRQPLSGWLGHAAPFDFNPSYHPAQGVGRFICGTPSPLALTALEAGVDSVLAAEPRGGIDALRAKSLALTDLFITLVEHRCAGHNLHLQTPRDPTLRGSQVSLLRDEGAYEIVQALIDRGVIADFRAPGILRFGFTPLYLRFVDVWDAVENLSQILRSGAWRQERFKQRAAVT